MNTKIKGFCFWTLSLTWGLPLTLVGLMLALAMLISGHKPKRFYYFIYFEVGDSWGGFNAGPIFLVGHFNSVKTTLQHEAGHGLQNIIFGPWMLILVTIPSAIRYWYRELVWHLNREKYWALPGYYTIWFEGWATQLGAKYYR